MRAGLALAAVLACAGCESEIPEPPEGGVIRGTVRYDGDAHRALIRPGIQVLAVPRVPPAGPPHGIVALEPELDAFGEVPFELKNLAPFAYKVFARVAELDDPMGGPMDLPLGAYPNFCALARSGPDTTVAVGADAPTENIDIVLFDDGGLADPCNVPSDEICPEPGASTLNVIIESSRAATSGDTVLVALFDVFPSMSPAVGYLLPGGDVSFPERVTDNGVAPGSYPAFYVCLDVGSNNLMSLCGAEDAFVLQTAPPIEMPAGQVVSLTVDLDAGTLTEAVDPPSAFGCP